MHKDKVDELIVSLTDIDVDAVGGGATLGGRMITPQNWDSVVLRGCCTQGCCGDQQRMV